MLGAMGQGTSRRVCDQINFLNNFSQQQTASRSFPVCVQMGALEHDKDNHYHYHMDVQ
jgi:hypothetical protein